MVSITTTKETKPEYPYLGISGDHIILFTEFESGFSFKYKYYGSWDESLFKPYNEPLTIQNEV